MKQKTRLLAAVLAGTLMLSTALTACSNTGSGGASSSAATSASSDASAAPSAASSSAAVTKPAEITMFMGTAGIDVPDGVDLADNPYINKIQELANVKITELTVPPYTDFATKLTLMLSSNTIPDVVHNWQPTDIGKAGAAGAFMELSDVIKNSAVLSKTYTDEMQNLMRYSDGNIYYLFTLSAPDPSAIGYRYDLIQELNDGVVPTTVDEWYELFKKEKAAYPDSIPASDFNGLGSTVPSLFWAYGVNPSGWQYTNGQYIHCFEAAHCKDAIVFVKKLYDEGLLSKTFITNTKQDYQAERNAKKTIYWANNYASVCGGVNATDPTMVTAPTPYPTTSYTDIDPYNAIPHISKLSMGHNIAINAKTKELDGCIRLVETLLSDDVSNLSVWGIEGTDYEVKDSQKTLLPAAKDHYYRRIFGFMFTYNTADAIANNITSNLDAYVTDAARKEALRAVFDEGKKKVFAASDTIPPINASNFVQVDVDTTNKVTEATELAKTIILKAITGEISLDEYDTQVKDFLTKYQSVTDAYNTSLSEVKAKYGY